MYIWLRECVNCKYMLRSATLATFGIIDYTHLVVEHLFHLDLLQVARVVITVSRAESNLVRTRVDVAVLVDVRAVGCRQHPPRCDERASTNGCSAV